LLVLAIAGPWYAAMVALHGRAYTHYFFIEEHLGRFSQPTGGHAGPIVYYPLVVMALFFPWSAFLPVAAARAPPPRAEGRELRVVDSDDAALCPQPSALSSIERFCLSWAGLVFLVFSLARTKLPHYVYPAYPALAVLVALAWERFRSGEAGARARVVT